MEVWRLTPPVSARTGWSSSVTASRTSSTIGYVSNSTTFAAQAFRWTSAGMAGLGYLSGETGSNANVVSADGAVVAGTSGSRGFRWTSATGVVDIGALPGKSC